MTEHPDVDELRKDVHDSCLNDPELAASCAKGCAWRIQAINAYEAALDENRRLVKALVLLVKDKGFQFVKEDKHGVVTRATFQEATAVIRVTGPQSSSGWVDATPCGCFTDQDGQLHTCSACQEGGGEA